MISSNLQAAEDAIAKEMFAGTARAHCLTEMVSALQDSDSEHANRLLTMRELVSKLDFELPGGKYANFQDLNTVAGDVHNGMDGTFGSLDQAVDQLRAMVEAATSHPAHTHRLQRCLLLQVKTISWQLRLAQHGGTCHCVHRHQGRGLRRYPQLAPCLQSCREAPSCHHKVGSLVVALASQVGRGRNEESQGSSVSGT